MVSPRYLVSAAPRGPPPTYGSTRNAIAYTKLRNVPLYLEWAPAGIFRGAATEVESAAAAELGVKRLAGNADADGAALHSAGTGAAENPPVVEDKTPRQQFGKL